MPGISTIWSNTKLIGRFAFIFRTPAFIVLAFAIVLHHLDHNLELSFVDKASIVLILLLPFIYFIHYYYSPNNKLLYIVHSTYDLFVVGWSIGLFNLSIIPSFFMFLAVLSNHVTIRGIKRIYFFLLVPLGTISALWLNNMVILTGFSDRMLYYFLAYAVVHFSILAYISNFYIILYLKNNRRLKNQAIEINEQKEEILGQSEELKTLNSSLNDLNSNLETLVRERTEELTMKNRVLSQYAFDNAHKLRAPLARILGLAQLFNYQIEVKEESNVLKMIEESAEELDRIVININKNLEDQNKSSNKNKI